MTLRLSLLKEELLQNGEIELHAMVRKLTPEGCVRKLITLLRSAFRTHVSYLWRKERIQKLLDYSLLALKDVEERWNFRFQKLCDIYEIFPSQPDSAFAADSTYLESRLKVLAALIQLWAAVDDGSVRLDIIQWLSGEYVEESLDRRRVVPKAILDMLREPAITLTSRDLELSIRRVCRDYGTFAEADSLVEALSRAWLRVLTRGGHTDGHWNLLLLMKAGSEPRL